MIPLNTSVVSLADKRLPICTNAGQHVSNLHSFDTSLGFNILDATNFAKNSTNSCHSWHNKHFCLKSKRLSPYSKFAFQKRVKILNNQIFSHIKNLEYSKFSADKDFSFSERLERLKNQMIFSSKFKVLTFKLLLLATKNKDLFIGKDKTIMQASYYEDKQTPHLLNRSTGSQSGVKKANDECHISCLPALFDNSKFRKKADAIIEKFTSEFNEGRITNEKDIADFTSKLNTVIEEDKKSIANLLEMYLLALQDSKHDFYNKESINKLIPHFSKSYTSIHTKSPESTQKQLWIKNAKCLTLMTNIQISIAKEGQDQQAKTSPLKTAFDKFTSSNEICYNAIETLKNLLNRNYKSLTDVEKKEKKDAIPIFNDNIEDFFSNFRRFIVDEFEILTPLLEKMYCNKTQFFPLKVYTEWAKSKEDPKEKVKKLLYQYGPSESQIPVNSILGMMLSTTLVMPQEINHKIDSLTDETHTKTAQLLSQFSQEKNATDETVKKYLNDYMNLLEDAYGKICNATDTSLEELIKNVDDNEENYLSSFIETNLSNIASFYRENTKKYDEDFEKLVMGEDFSLEKDADLLLQPITELEICDHCWKASDKVKNEAGNFFLQKV